ncbi:adenylate/guanylate cyclase domain-containing protein [Candidatus Nitrosocosmicus franklandus]|uniref:Adenylate cyclase 2 n=1 Tax=Candidatus Nitrosocosmicus franklandianus TaxID=1798806 RepID=A0A484I6P5_9ARCH|nr:adenylate/guanylate cyclase domain-containing protein [Candidatus Nitrosocosmicus franklandus]VFJ13399.1 Adenylate cyclase 2 [Candidatus Nitrosocosmicus franklandus]
MSGGRDDPRNPDKKDIVDDDDRRVLEDVIYKKSSADSRETEIFDLKTLVHLRQDRLWSAIKERYRYNTSIKRGQDYLIRHVDTKVPLVIMYADLVGSTKMSMTLPIEKLVTIIRAFSHELSSVIESLNGYVLKYAGDAIIAFFPSGFNKYLTCDNAYRCAKSMISIIKDGINPILSKQDFPNLSVKIGIDEGENIIFQYGYDKSSQIDILSYTMNVTSKITSITPPNKISVGENVYKLLHPQIQTGFRRIAFDTNEWKYIDIKSGNPYEVYTLM